MKTNRVRISREDKAVSAAAYLIITILCLFILLPCLNVLALSFNDGKDAAAGGVWFWPRKWSTQNYREVFHDGSILRAYGITVARTLVGTAMSLAVTACAAFALNQTELPGRGIITFAFTFTMLFGGGTIPTYIQYKDLHLLNTFWVYVIPPLVSVTYLIMMRASFNSIPYALNEAAKLDGCGYVRTFIQVILPLSKPVLAVVALYTAVGHWNDWYAGAFYQKSKDMWPVQTVLQQMLARATKTEEAATVGQAIAAENRGSTTDSLKMAAVVITTVPILCIYPFAQKYFAKGALIGAVKG